MDTVLYLFDNTVKPVLLCGSEILGTINITTVRVQKDSFNLFNALSDLPYEKLHIGKKMRPLKGNICSCFFY